MKLSKLGERAIIEKVGRFLDIGDDAAFIRFGNGFLVLTTDTVYAPAHIPEEMTPEQIGKFIVTVNLSDLAAMGAKPLTFLLSYGGPDMEFIKFRQIIKAADKQCRRFGIRLMGGDTKEMKELTLTGCAVGATKRPVLRSGAGVGDIIAVTGDLGDAGICFELLRRNLKPSRPLLKAALEPKPRVREGLLLGECANSMTDISDSLAVGLYSIAEQSQVGMHIDINKIPISKSASNTGREFNLNVIDHALYSGGDYQILFTVPEKNFGRIENSINVTGIGKVTGKGMRATRNGRGFKLKKQGYEHFKSR